MRAYQIAMFLLLFQLSAALIDYSGVFPDNTYSTNSSDYNAWENKAKGAWDTTAGYENDQAGELMQSKDLFHFIETILVPKVVLSSLGVPDEIGWIFSVLTWVIWASAIAQFFRGISFSSQA